MTQLPFQQVNATLTRSDFTFLPRFPRNAAKLCLAALAFVLATSSFAQGPHPERAGQLKPRGGIQAQTLLAKPGMQVRAQRMSMKDAISLAEDRHGGRAVGAKRHFAHGQPMQYRVRLLREDGKVKTVIVP